ncbi:hypothetical protein KI387_033776 [Taxus chinensis]|uniref:RPW8 domain-containing protein n=1 Tax=Taxus chinensis TaxID=29808 RepID=A0AA38F279_TAXCH|nr:hypothetical protein KI387_033776 [Taxus chinensis]
MASIVVGAAVGVALQEVFTATKKGVPYLIKVFSSSASKKHKKTLNRLKPVIDEIYELSLGTSPETWLRTIQDFRGKIADGLRLAEDCDKTSLRKLHKKFSYVKKIQNLEKDISDFINTNLLPNMALDVKRLPNYSNQLNNLSNDMKDIASNIDAHTQEISLLRRQIIENSGANVEQQEWSLCVPNTPSFLVGFEKSIVRLKELVLDNTVSVVGVTGMSGSGKSTIASALCHHNEIKEYFKKNVIYITVSKSPNLRDILETMWENIVGGPKPGFKNVEEAHKKLQWIIGSRRNQPILVILDDVCSMSDLEKLTFEGDQYKTLVTTRDESIILKQRNAVPYRLPLLEEENALSLFCHWAFGEPTIPNTHDKDLVKQVQADCKGLPLALRVIGSSLRDEPPPVWKIAKNKLSRGEPISGYHEDELCEHLKTTSIDVLDDYAKQCFLDLAAFPQGQIISANALLDIWVYVHGMDWDDAFMVLWEFKARSLLELKRDPWGPGVTYGSAHGLSFSQHNVMRNLALYLAKQDNKIHYKRLYMPEKHYCNPSKWHTINSCKAQIVSIHTGAMDDIQWSQMEFTEAEALVLFSTASGYCIPTFLHTMKKLKVLIVHNYSARRAKLDGLDGFSGLSQLKTLQLERLIVPPLYDYLQYVRSLEKLSLSLCEGLGNMNRSGRDETLNLPGLSEINVDHCSHLEELPSEICSLNSLKMLSVTNCHRLAKLPDELGKLGALKVLRLCACAGLTALPPSIRSLQQLKFLDISLCGSLKAFPQGFHELSRLKKLDMRECCKLRHLSQTVSKLTSLEHVICDTKNQQHLMSICKANSTSKLTVEVVEESFSLDWLFD